VLGFGSWAGVRGRVRKRLDWKSTCTAPYQLH